MSRIVVKSCPDIQPPGQSTAQLVAQHAATSKNQYLRLLHSFASDSRRENEQFISAILRSVQDD